MKVILELHKVVKKKVLISIIDNIKVHLSIFGYKDYDIIIITKTNYNIDGVIFAFSFEREKEDIVFHYGTTKEDVILGDFDAIIYKEDDKIIFEGREDDDNNDCIEKIIKTLQDKIEITSGNQRKREIHIVINLLKKTFDV